LLKERKNLGFHSIAISYEYRKQGSRKNKYKQECHAHVHFTPDAWSKVKDNVMDKMKDKVKDNDDILLKFDARNLLDQIIFSTKVTCSRTSTYAATYNVEENNKLLISVRKSIENIGKIKQNN
jgi:hypothetical protein